MKRLLGPTNSPASVVVCSITSAISQRWAARSPGTGRPARRQLQTDRAGRQCRRARTHWYTAAAAGGTPWRQAGGGYRSVAGYFRVHSGLYWSALVVLRTISNHSFLGAVTECLLLVGTERQPLCSVKSKTLTAVCVAIDCKCKRAIKYDITINM